MAKLTTVVVLIAVEIVLLGYGVYGLVDRGLWVLLVGAAILSALWCLGARVGPTTAIVLHSALAISIASAWGFARDFGAAAFSFGPGLLIMFVGSKLFYSSSYDPVGHPLLWGLATVVNITAWHALLWLAISLGRKRTRASSRSGAT
jgi:hypothetical protein